MKHHRIAPLLCSDEPFAEQQLSTQPDPASLLDGFCNRTERQSAATGCHCVYAE